MSKTLKELINNPKLDLAQLNESADTNDSMAFDPDKTLLEDLSKEEMQKFIIDLFLPLVEEAKEKRIAQLKDAYPSEKLKFCDCFGRSTEKSVEPLRCQAVMREGIGKTMKDQHFAAHEHDVDPSRTDTCFFCDAKFVVNNNGLRPHLSFGHYLPNSIAHLMSNVFRDDPERAIEFSKFLVQWYQYHIRFSARKYPETF